MEKRARSKRVIIGEGVSNKLLNKENLKLLARYKKNMTMRELSEKSIYNYEKDIEQWLKFIYLEQDNKDIIEMDEDEVEEFIFYCKQKGNNAERIKRRCSSLSAFFKFLRKRKLINENPLEYIDRPKKGVAIVEQNYLSKDQVSKMLKLLKESKDTRLETYALFSLSTMARVTAISSVRWEQINFETRTVKDVLEKEGKIVTLYFDEPTKKALTRLKAHYKKNDIECEYVFCTKYEGKYKKCDTTTLRNWAKKIGKLIEIDCLSPHDFRHSMATLYVNNGMPVEKVSALLNHSGLDVTVKHYIRQDEKKVAEEKDKYTINF